MKLIIFIIPLLVSLTTFAKESTITPTKSGLFDAGGFKLYLECYENDKPKLVLEQGFGRSGSDGVWLENIERLKGDYSICLYDRAGLGKSEAGPVPFTVNDMATRLHKLLKTADVEPPYYFAGGSYAFYIFMSYNNLYPKELLGAVLIAPPPFGYFYTMGNRWPKNFKTDDKKLERLYHFEQSVHNPMFARVPENVDHIKSYEILSKVSNFGNKPVIAIRSKQTAKRYDPPYVPGDIAKVMDKLYGNAEDAFKALSSNSLVVYSESEKHHLHISDRDLVVDSIKKLLKMR